MVPTITPTQIDVPPGGAVILKGQTWDDYETVLTSRQHQAALKISFSASTQEICIMSPLPKHAHGSAILVDLIKALLRFHELDWQDFDPVTLKKFQLKGLEPDHCFYIQNYRAIVGKERIDLSQDPPPDLAVEVDLTSFSTVDEYEELGIPELWIYREQALRIYCLDSTRYVESDESQLFPGRPLTQMIPHYVEQAWREGSSAALRAFEKNLRSGA